jgi:hypothetical protein
MRQPIQILALLVGLISCQENTKGTADAPVNSSADILFPVKAQFINPVRTYDTDTLIARVDKTDFQITPEGKVSWGHDPADTFHLATEILVEKAFLYVKNDTLFAFYTETDNDVATSRLEKIDLGSRRRIWKSEIPGFNLGIPYIRENFAYVTTIGGIGKLDLYNGRYVYQNTDLYDREKDAFNNFDTILFQEDLTIFVSRKHINNRIDSIIVKESTGEITIKK